MTRTPPGGLGDFLSVIDVAVKNQALLAKIPLIGDALKDAVRFVGDLKERVVDNLNVFGGKTPAIVQQKIYEAIGPGGLNWLRDASNPNWRTSPLDLSAINVNDVVLNKNGSSEVQYSVRLKQSLARVSVPVDFDLGLPLLGLDVNGQVQLDIGFDWELSFGLDKNKGFYLTTGVSDEMRLSIEAAIPDLSVAGRLGTLDVNVTDGAMVGGVKQNTKLVAQLNVDLRDPGTGAGNDGRLTMSELSAAGASQVVAAYFPNTPDTNRADIRLHLVGSLGENSSFPQIETDLTIGWAFQGVSPTTSTASFGSKPEIWLRNVQIDPGQVIQTFAKPILEQVNSVLAPVKPILEVLQSPLPIISELAGRPFSILDVTEKFGPLFGGKISKGTREFIKAVADLNSLMSYVQAISSTGNINIGSFLLSDAAGGDIRKGSLSGIDPGTLPGATAPLTNYLPISARDFLDRANAVPSGNGTGAGFELPILKNPLGILQILMGRDVDLFTYDMPQMQVIAPFRMLIPILPPALWGFFGGSIGAQADFNFGFNTVGIRNGRPMDGLYIQDTIGGTAGANDPMEALLFGTIEAGGLIGGSWGPVSIEAGVAGGIVTQVGLNLNDPNNDGKVYLPELSENLSRGVEWVFDAQGSMDAYLRAFINISIEIFGETETLFSDERELARIHLLDFSKPKRGAISNEPLGNVSSGVLTLSFKSDQDDNFRISQDAQGSIVVNARGRSQTFTGVTSITDCTWHGSIYQHHCDTHNRFHFAGCTWPAQRHSKWSRRCDYSSTKLCLLHCLRH